MTKLQECPFCGGGDLDEFEPISAGQWDKVIRCRSCWARGPHEEDLSVSPPIGTLWNRAGSICIQTALHEALAKCKAELSVYKTRFEAFDDEFWLCDEEDAYKLSCEYIAGVDNSPNAPDYTPEGDPRCNRTQ